MNSWGALSVVVVAMGLTTCVGCTKTLSYKLARHQVGTSAVTQPALCTAVYKVKWADRIGGDFRSLPSSERIVRAGETLGFETIGGGAVIAIAGIERFELTNLPPHAQTCVWYVREEVPTKFGRELVKALDTTGQVAAYTSVAAAFVAASVLEQKLDDALDSDEQDHKHKRRERHHREDRTKPATKPSR